MSIKTKKSFAYDPEQYLKLVTNQLETFPVAPLNHSIGILQEAHRHERNVFLIANGGSAGFLSHWEVDWIKGIYLATNKPLNAVAITSRLGLFSAASNDFGWHVAFQEILRIQAKKGDVLIAVSSSGESENIINATRFANKNGINCISLSGMGDTTLSRISEVSIALSSTDMQVIEDCHQVFGHIVLKSFGGKCQT